ncbi:KRBBB protein, partial [Polypterus senegalus]
MHVAPKTMKKTTGCCNVSLSHFSATYATFSPFYSLQHNDSEVFNIIYSVHCDLTSPFLLQERVQKHIKTHSKHNYWIGMSRDDTRLDWHWVYGTPLHSISFSLDKSDPSLECSMIISYGLKTSRCATENKWICERSRTGSDTGPS